MKIKYIKTDYDPITVSLYLGLSVLIFASAIPPTKVHLYVFSRFAHSTCWRLMYN